jgi:hypothetical protein
MPSKPKAPQTGYKAALVKLELLRGQAGAAAYDRVKLAAEQIFEDRDFRADLGNFDDFQAGDFLNPYFEDLCLEFLQLRSMLEFYPERERWAEGKLATMRREMLESRGQPEEEAVKRERPRWKEVAADLEKRIKELEAENAALRGQIHDLRKLLSEPAVA